MRSGDGLVFLPRLTFCFLSLYFVLGILFDVDIPPIPFLRSCSADATFFFFFNGTDGTWVGGYGLAPVS